MKKNTLPGNIIGLIICIGLLTVVLGLWHILNPKIDLPQSVLNEIAKEEAIAEFNNLRPDVDFQFNTSDREFKIYWRGHVVQTFPVMRDLTYQDMRTGQVISSRWEKIVDTLSMSDYRKWSK